MTSTRTKVLNRKQVIEEMKKGYVLKECWGWYLSIPGYPTVRRDTVDWLIDQHLVIHLSSNGWGWREPTNG